MKDAKLLMEFEGKYGTISIYNSNKDQKEDYEKFLRTYCEVILENYDRIVNSKDN